MKWLDQWKRKRDGWVERKRGIQKLFVGKAPQPPHENVPDVSDKKVTAAENQSVKQE